MASTGETIERLESPQRMTPPKVFRFLSLPTEIRLMVYSLLLLFPEEWIYFTTNRHKPARIHHRNHSKAPRYLYPAILRTYHQIELEATPILYGHNGFCNAPEYCNIGQFLEAIGCRNSTLIRRAIVGLPRLDENIYEEKQIVEAVEVSVAWTKYFGERCPNLEVICVRLDSSNKVFMMGEPTAKVFEYFKLVVQLFRDAFPKLKKVSLPRIDRKDGFLSTAQERHCFEYLEVKRKSDETCTWGIICDFLEGNGWVIGSEV